MKTTKLFAAASVLTLAACQYLPDWATRSDMVAEPPEAEITETADAAAMTQEQIIAEAGAPLFEGMGDFHREISTDSEYAQKYFDQGMVLAFGFNHAESIRSFRAAQTLDPDCAMCFWGEALATGPNINVTSKGKAVMSPEDRASAFAAINKALALKETATPAEQALIEALATRYNGASLSDRIRKLGTRFRTSFRARLDAEAPYS